jgi:indolepyruvate ferredoxin oxidoreductase, beta subunit
LPERPISIAILAMGGQGGGVLADWIVALAEAAGWQAQSTSVPGVAQRTGATIYYLEMLPPADRAPVFALSPVPGDVDIVIAAELAEAGRAIQRGFVTPDKTTLIASSHRAYAVSEKIVPGDGLADSAAFIAAGTEAAKRFLYFDMAAEAERSGSVISAVLFGALAGAEALPFPRAAFETTIRAGGVGVEASLAAFAAGYARSREPATLAVAGKVMPALPETAGHPELDRLLQRVRQEFPALAHPMIYAGLRRVVDYQDPAYGDDYLTRLGEIAALDNGTHALLIETARHLAVAMCYDDIIRVADLKTREQRFARVRGEVAARADQPVYTTEFMHPRLEELCGSLPAGLGRAILGSGIGRLLRPLVDRGRRVRTGTIGWFLLLYAIGGMRRFRRGTMRHQEEMAHIAAWLDRVRQAAPANYALAVEIVKCRRLVKGYSDTHARGLGKFDKVIAAADRLARHPDAAAALRKLREAALADEEGKALTAALATVDA